MQPSVPDSFDLDMDCGDWNSNDYEPSQQEGPALEATDYNLRPHRAPILLDSPESEQENAAEGAEHGRHPRTYLMARDCVQRLNGVNRHDCGPMDQLCEHCGARMIRGERTGTLASGEPAYSICCCKGTL